jgi:hypothetical protein
MEEKYVDRGEIGRQEILYGNTATCKVLLITDVFVRRKQKIKPGFFGYSQQLAVG